MLMSKSNTKKDHSRASCIGNGRKRNIRCIFLFHRFQFYVHGYGEFLKTSPKERSLFILKRKLCRWCFKGGCCGKCSFRCEKCHRFHYILIHIHITRVTSKTDKKVPRKIVSSMSIQFLIYMITF